MGDFIVGGTNGFTEDVWDDTAEDNLNELQREWEARREKCWNVRPYGNCSSTPLSSDYLHLYEKHHLVVIFRFKSS